MDATLIYFLKTNLALVFFYAFYRLLGKIPSSVSGECYCFYFG